MAYNLKKALGTAATIGVTGLAAIVIGESSREEIVKNLGYIVTLGSVLGAAVASARYFIGE